MIGDALTRYDVAECIYGERGYADRGRHTPAQRCTTQHRKNSIEHAPSPYGTPSGAIEAT
jgi:hypothetical protein